MSPPYTITAAILQSVADIGEQIGRLEVLQIGAAPVKLRREHRILTVQASLAIEGNTLSPDQVTAIVEGKRVLGPATDIQAVRNALAAYEELPKLDPSMEADLCRAHRILMRGLVDEPGVFRRGDVGIQKGDAVVHIAPGADRVPFLIAELLEWLRDTDAHPLVAGAVFHYELEFVHPFMDGNGRLGRLWQTLILHRWKPLFQFVPIESVIQNRQREYYSALRAADAQAEATPFVAFMLDAVRAALEELAAVDRLGDPVTDPVTDQVVPLLRALRNGPKGASLLMKELSLSHRPTFRKNYLNPALDRDLIERTLPDKPTSSRQQYRLTRRGRGLLTTRKHLAGKR